MEETIKEIRTEICIVGAGPAGASTSIFLGKLGINHVIIDAAKFPRNKVCGDGLDLKSIRMLQQIDLDIFEKEIIPNPVFQSCRGVRLIHPSGKNKDFIANENKDFPHRFPYYVCKRFDFDHFLLSKINPDFAIVHTASKLTKIEKMEQGWRLTVEQEIDKVLIILTNLIVGADGDHSVVLRHLGERKINRQHYAGSVRQYFSGVQGMHEAGLIEFYFPKKYPFSYFWIFPLPNGEANVGFIMMSQYAAQHKHNIKQIFAELIQEDPVLKSRFAHAKPVGDVEGWGLPLSSLQRKAAGDGWILVGDAASLVSPANGEGIGNSLLSGFIAAQAIGKGVKENSFSADTFKNYQPQLYKWLQEEIDWYQFASTKNPRLLNWCINNLIADNFITQFLFKKWMRKWLETAYTKPFLVQL